MLEFVLMRSIIITGAGSGIGRATALAFAAEGDRVVIRFTSSGTQRGEFAGVAPHGEKVTIHEAAIYRVVAGKIVEQWGFPDSQSLTQQLTAAAKGKP